MRVLTLASAMIVMDYNELLSEISIDNHHFKVTWSPMQRDACILWFRDVQLSATFEALGQFTRFEKRRILEFVVRYATSAELREDIDNRRFARRVENLPPTFFRSIERLSARDKERAYRSLFNLDEVIDPGGLAARRRIMAKRFHPDAGGDTKAMSLINEAYDYLSNRARY